MGGVLGMGDGVLGPNPQSPIPNPQSPIPIIIYYKYLKNCISFKIFNYLNYLLTILNNYFK